MTCECDSCSEDVAVPPADYADPRETAYEMAYDACWQDGADYE